jgi:hypothetical protein
VSPLRIMARLSALAAKKEEKTRGKNQNELSHLQQSREL